MSKVDRYGTRGLAVIASAVLLGSGLASAGLFLAAAPPAGATPSCTGAATVTCTVSYTGAADSFTVPPGVTQVTITADGAGGADNTGSACSVTGTGGTGARVVTTLPSIPSTTFTINVGGTGGKGCNGTGVGGAGGFNGGAPGGAYPATGFQDEGPGGGGASSLSVGGSLLVVAGGGGAAGGTGGTSTGGNGSNGGTSDAISGTTGSATGPGASPGQGGGGGSTSTSTGGTRGQGGTVSFCSSGNGGTGGGFTGATVGTGGTGGSFTSGCAVSIAGNGGGGGGGYFAGGGGGSAAVNNLGTGGGGGGAGGGSSFATPTGTGTTYSTSPIGTANNNGRVTITYTLPTTPVVASAQFGIPNQTDVFSVAPNGEVDVRWVQGAGKWNGPLAISAPGLAQPGSFLAASAQFGAPNQTDVFVVDKSGTVDVLWVQGAGKWNGPLAISATGLAAPGAHLAASNQFGIPNQTDVFVVDTTGTAQVLWVQGVGKWNGPLQISPTGLAPSGAGLATSNQFGIPSQTDVFVVDKSGTVDVLWVQGAGKWNGPLGISPSGLAPAGAGLSSSRQFGIPNQTDVFVSDASGTVDVLWVQGAGKWNGPLGISPTGLAQPGGELSSSAQFGIPVSGAPIQTDVFVSDHTGTLQVLWVENAGKWNGPLQIGPTGLGVAGAGLASSNQFGIPNQTNVWLANTSGALQVFWVQNTGAWKGPLAI